MTPKELRQARIALRLSQHELAKALGVCSRSVYRWERGDTKPLPIAVRAIRALMDEREVVTKR